MGWTLGAALAEGYRLAGLGLDGNTAAQLRMSSAATGRGVRWHVVAWWALLLGLGMVAAGLLAAQRCSWQGTAMARPALRRLFSEPAELLPMTSPPPKHAHEAGGIAPILSPPSTGSSSSSASWRRSAEVSGSPLRSLGARLFGSSLEAPWQRSQSWATFATADGVHRDASYSSLHRLSTTLSNRRIALAVEGGDGELAGAPAQPIL